MGLKSAVWWEMFTQLLLQLFLDVSHVPWGPFLPEHQNMWTLQTTDPQWESNTCMCVVAMTMGCRNCTCQVLPEPPCRIVKLKWETQESSFSVSQIPVMSSEFRSAGRCEWAELRPIICKCQSDQKRFCRLCRRREILPQVCADQLMWVGMCSGTPHDPKTAGGIISVRVWNTAGESFSSNL